VRVRLVNGRTLWVKDVVEDDDEGSGRRAVGGAISCCRGLV
jgi:hypothetical protein